jgi:hypothetical protein
LRGRKSHGATDKGLFPVAHRNPAIAERPHEQPLNRHTASDDDGTDHETSPSQTVSPLFRKLVNKASRFCVPGRKFRQYGKKWSRPGNSLALLRGCRSAATIAGRAIAPVLHKPKAIAIAAAMSSALTLKRTTKTTAPAAANRVCAAGLPD